MKRLAFLFFFVMAPFAGATGPHGVPPGDRPLAPRVPDIAAEIRAMATDQVITELRSLLVARYTYATRELERRLATDSSATIEALRGRLKGSSLDTRRRIEALLESTRTDWESEIRNVLGVIAGAKQSQEAMALRDRIRETLSAAPGKRKPAIRKAGLRVIHEGGTQEIPVFIARRGDALYRLSFQGDLVSIEPVERAGNGEYRRPVTRIPSRLTPPQLAALGARPDVRPAPFELVAPSVSDHTGSTALNVGDRFFERVAAHFEAQHPASAAAIREARDRIVRADHQGFDNGEIILAPK